MYFIYCFYFSFLVNDVKLLKYTPEGHPDHHNSQEALVAATTLCAQVSHNVYAVYKGHIQVK